MAYDLLIKNGMVVDAAGIVLANTELPLLIRTEDTHGMIFDSMAIHINKAVSLALAAEAI